MQNKGLVKFIAIIFTLVCLYQLSFTFVSRHYEKKAKEFAQGDLTKESRFLDSIGNQVVYLGNTYKEVRDKQLQRGLDLEGGINVTLQISIGDILKGLSNNSHNAIFNQALEEAKTNRRGNQTYLNAFYEAFDRISNGTVKLSSPEIFANRSLPEINSSMSNDEVKSILNQKVQESIESAYKVFGERIDKFGVVSPTIQMIGNTGRILIELPGAKDIDRVQSLLQSTAQLEFWETYKVEEAWGAFMAANEYLRTAKSAEKTNDTLADVTAESDVDKMLGVSDNKDDNPGPLVSLMAQQGFQGSPIIAYYRAVDKDIVDEYLNQTEVQNIFSRNLRHARLVWGKPEKSQESHEELVALYAIKGNAQNEPPLSGSVITGASQEYDNLNRAMVSMSMNAKGAKEWEALTGKAYTQGTNIAIVLDNVVYSAPGVTTGPISGGNSTISGNFTVAEAKDLANILQAGKLPASADIIASEIVGPSLGEQAVNSGLLSAVVALVVVGLWMVFYYGRAGWYADIALLVNLLFLFGVMTSFGFVLTLPGIAGIVLTLGTAVDANILIYETVKDEMRRGKTFPQAVAAAYGWGGSAMRPIIDANVTHIITGVILFIFGTGPIKGFATTLLVGIFTSLFTALFIARIFIDMDIKKNKVLAFSTNITKNWFTKFNYNFLGKRKWTYAFSSLVFIVSVVSLSTNGLDQGVEFVGGRTFQVRFDQPADHAAISSKLSEDFGVNVEVKQFGPAEQVRIITKFMIEDESSEVDEQVNKMLHESLQGFYKKPLDYQEFINTSDEAATLGVVQATKVNPTMSNDIKTDAFWAVIGAIGAIFIYLVISFKKWQYSFGTVVAIVHDVVFVLGIYSLLYKYMPFHMEIDQHFIAAILTVISYSVNDTVVVFDRVREYLTGNSEKGKSVESIVNKAVNTTIARTINTSLTLIFVLLVMFIFGGDSIRGFMFAMLVGIIVGTYSSLFLATPILVDTLSKKEKQAIEERHNNPEEGELEIIKE